MYDTLEGVRDRLIALSDAEFEEMGAEGRRYHLSRHTEDVFFGEIAAVIKDVANSSTRN